MLTWITKRLRPGKRAHPRVPESAEQIRQEAALSPLERVRLELLRGKTWRYLRYLHLREGLLAAQDCRSVFSIGCGLGLAELALAIEFPDRSFHLTDIESERTPNYRVSQDFARRWSLGNLTFGVHDVMRPTTEAAADLVCSVEVLEHIEDDATAARNMIKAARKAVFCLVPYADERAKADKRRQQHCWEKFGHYRPGYTAADLEQLFPGTLAMRGCYWADAGAPFRTKLTALPREEITLALADEAAKDIRDGLPSSFPEAYGIWSVSRKMNA
jgi:SAM-dependent methyltransferase